MLSGSWTASIWGIWMASITMGCEQPCNLLYAYTRSAPMRIQIIAGGGGQSELLPCSPKIMQEVCPRAWQLSAGLQSSMQKHPLVRQPAQGCWSLWLCWRSSHKRTSSGISYKTPHRFPRCFWPLEGWQPANFHEPYFYFHPFVIITFK